MRQAHRVREYKILILINLKFNFKAPVVQMVISSLISVYNTQTMFQCLIKMPIDTSKVFRKSENCDMCRNINSKEINQVTNITKTEFEEKYAHTGVPVIITDGAIKWPALDTFNFDFFKEIYSHDKDHPNVIDECQFFPYKTEFKSLQEVFNMSVERSKLLPGTEPWYVGWSNCNDNAGKMLRQYYSEPYFLPDNSENIALSWIFMGGPGNGAHMHVSCYLKITKIPVLFFMFSLSCYTTRLKCFHFHYDLIPI